MHLMRRCLGPAHPLDGIRSSSSFGLVAHQAKSSSLNAPMQRSEGAVNLSLTLRFWSLTVLLLPLLCSGCSLSYDPSLAARTGHVKIHFDLDRLNDEGLQGPPGGLRALHYEYCLKDDPASLRQAASIDPTFERQRGSGRAGCVSDEVLALGHTHQADHLEVLLRLADMDEIGEIHECFFE